MKKLVLLIALLGLALGCTDSPTAPDSNAGPGDIPTSGYSITLSPQNATAYVNLDAILSPNEKIGLTATVKKDGQVITASVVVIFTVSGGALFVETGATSRETYTVNGVAAATVWSPEAGTFPVKVFIKGSQSVQDTANTTFVLSTELFITPPLSPSTGSIVGGDTVTISGGGFVYPLEVYFGAERAVYVSNTYSSIVVRTPVHFPSECNANDPVDVTVTVYPGESAQQSATLPAGFIYLSEVLEPTITAVSPNHGDNDGGTLVTIYGTNFYCGEGVLVYFSNPKINPPIEIPGIVRECAPTQLLVETPSARDVGVENCNQTVDIRIVNVCGGMEAKLTASFTYGPNLDIYGVSPHTVPIMGGVPIIIYGQGFDAPLSVAFGTSPVTFPTIVSVSESEIVVLPAAWSGACAGAGASYIEVTDLDCGITQKCVGSSISACMFGYDVPELTIISVTPDSGGAGTIITITGTGFIDPVTVTIGSATATATLNSGTSITATVPTITTGLDTGPCTTASGCDGTQALPTELTITVMSETTGCSATSTFTYVPSTACTPPPPTCADLAATATGSAPCTLTFNALASYCGATPAYNWIVPDCTSGGGTGNPFVCTVPSAGGVDTSGTATVEATTPYGNVFNCDVPWTLAGADCP